MCPNSWSSGLVLGTLILGLIDRPHSREGVEPMSILTAKLAAIPPEVLGTPGRALLEDLLLLNADWAVDVVTMDGHWYLVEKNQPADEDLTPIEMFNLEEANLFME
jgi:hypothetical protein